MTNEMLVLGPVPEYALAGKLQFTESTREQRESEGYYVGADLTAKDMEDHRAFEEVKEDWIAQQKEAWNDPVQSGLRDGYFGA